jgi:hypothetical protein
MRLRRHLLATGLALTPLPTTIPILAVVIALVPSGRRCCSPPRPPRDPRAGSERGQVSACSRLGHHPGDRAHLGDGGIPGVGDRGPVLWRGSWWGGGSHGESGARRHNIEARRKTPRRRVAALRSRDRMVDSRLPTHDLRLGVSASSRCRLTVSASAPSRAGRPPSPEHRNRPSYRNPPSSTVMMS